jgi:sugar/nucleoside kinase (ribokinase family)
VAHHRIARSWDLHSLGAACGRTTSRVIQGTQLHVDAVAADQVDATGAGDAFTVGVLHGLLRGDDMATALHVGAAWGAATVAQLRSIPVPWEELAGPFGQPGGIRP